MVGEYLCMMIFSAVPTCEPAGAIVKLLGSSVGSLCDAGDGDLDVTQTEVVLDKEDLAGLNVDFNETEDEAFEDDCRFDSPADCSTIDRFHDCETSLNDGKNLSEGIKSAIECSVDCMLFDGDGKWIIVAFVFLFISM